MAECPDNVSLWTVQQLKDFLRERNINLSGNKSELVSKVTDIIATDSLKRELEAVPFQSVEYSAPPSFSCLPSAGNWVSEQFPVILENAASVYLKAKSGYTKNFRTGVRLCQCGHLFDVEMTGEVSEPGSVYIRAKCRPTMRKDPPFYTLFVIFKDRTPIAGNCKCPAGESQTCVHVAALLIMLSEITPQACTSVRCAWSRTSQGKASLSSDLDFGKASSEGYTVYDGTVQPINGLLELLEGSESNAGILDFMKLESDRCQRVTTQPSNNPVLIDPLDKLSEIFTVREVTVDDLVDALKPTSEEVQLIQEMSVGQRNNPLWFDARQWRVTSSNFGRVCNRNFRQLYPPSLVKSLLGDYGSPYTAAIQWGCDHEGDAISNYSLHTQSPVRECGIFLSTSYPYLATSPDGLISVGTELGLVEVKCPFKHRKSTIEEACNDRSFCLANTDNGVMLKRTHDYYQITGQLALTGARCCDFVVWTENDVHIERIAFDSTLWNEMRSKLEHFYFNCLGVEILQCLIDM